MNQLTKKNLKAIVNEEVNFGIFEQIENNNDRVQNIFTMIGEHDRLKEIFITTNI
jgi:hypothetical protein